MRVKRLDKQTFHFDKEIFLSKTLYKPSGIYYNTTIMQKGQVYDDCRYFNIGNSCRSGCVCLQHCSILFREKKEATQDGQKSGAIETDIKNISRQIDEMKTSFDRMNLKMDTVDEKRESEYRTMLVSVAELTSSYKSLHKRVDAIEQKLDYRRSE